MTGYSPFDVESPDEGLGRGRNFLFRGFLVVLPDNGISGRDS